MAFDPWKHAENALGIPEIRERLRRIPNRLNEYGYDAWGFHPETAARVLSLAYALYRRYWRVEVHGIERVPHGRVVLAANHSGQLPVDGLLLWVAMAMEADPPRIARGMAERWFPTLPYISILMPRMGHVLGDPTNCERLLENGEAILVFPEGARGCGKTWWHRYELVDFGQGFVRLALKTRSPIVPIAVIGGEEQMPSLYNWETLARLLGMPYFPVTPTFPLLGPLGGLPLPTKYHIYFDEPVEFEGDPDGPDAEIVPMVEVVKSKIKRMIEYGLEQRTSVWW